MHSLADTLDRFNRKERNLLVRAMLADGRLPPLTKHFCDQVGQKLGFPIPESAWWATDYQDACRAATSRTSIGGSNALHALRPT